MKNFLPVFAVMVVLFVAKSSFGQTVLLDHRFQSNSLPAGVTSNGTISPTKAADGVCTQGMIQVNSGQYLQVDINSCGLFTVNMKSTSSTSARTVTVKYKKYGEVAYTTATTSLSVLAAASFNFTTLYPAIAASAPVSVRIEPTSGNIQVHDLYVQANSALNNEAEVLAFKLPSQIGNEVINATNRTIAVTLPNGTSLSSIIPSSITTSYNATVSPAITTAQDFSSPVIYTIISENGAVTKNWTVNVSLAPSGAKDITAFKLANNQIGNAVINSAAGTVVVTMSTSANISSLAPVTLTISPFATISPSASTILDFNNPVVYTVTAQDNSTKVWTVTVNKIVPNYKISTEVSGLGKITLNPPGGTYPENTVVTLTATPILNSAFTSWTAGASGTNSTSTITVTSDTLVKASFTSNYDFEFNKVKGFAAMAGDGFAGPTIGGGCTTDTLKINGPSDFNLLCEALYNRWQAYKKNQTWNGMKKAPLVILLKAGVYDGTQTLSTDGAKVFANYMLDIPEQGDLTFLGDNNVVFKIGINVKRAYNLIIRNISFYDYYDDGVNINYPETHHIWVDHCTFGHPTTMPQDTEHPDGGCDTKEGASYISISWCVFRNSWKTSLVGHSDNNGAEDIGRLKVTYYNNYFLGTNSRNPRVRFGEVHVLNNLSERIGLYGIAAANSSSVFAEKNFYLNCDWPMYADRSTTDFKAIFGNNTDNIYTSKTGNIAANGLKQSGNAYDDSGLPVITAQVNPTMLNPGGRSLKFDELNPSTVFDPSAYYTYTALDAEDVRLVVPMFAGADKMQVAANCQTTMPLTFLTVTAALTQQESAVVSWSTANEINTAVFELQRSLDGNRFATIAVVQAKNSAGINQYSLNDAALPIGTTYYRVKQVDTDGAFTYSKTVSVTKRSDAAISLYPNPANNKLTIRHGRATSAFIQIVGADGRVHQSIKAVSGSVATELNVSTLPTGNYLVIYNNNGERSFSKFIKN
jgi:pectate lyase